MKISNIVSRRNRILLRELVVTDFKLRYQGSVLGYLWSLLKPLMLFAILYVVFVNFLRIGAGIEHIAVYLLLGMVMWTFFTEATKQGMEAIVSRGDLIRKINFPKYIIVISGTLSALINLCINLLVVFVFMIINQVDFSKNILLLPFNVLEFYVFSVAVAFILAALYVKFRDISHIWEVVLQGAFYATPILYPLSAIITINLHAAQLLILNPLATIIQDARYNSVTKQTETIHTMFPDNIPMQLVPHIIIIITTIFAVYYFKKNQKYFAENV